MSISLPATSIDTLAESSIDDLASSTIDSSTPVEHTPEYSRLITYDPSVNEYASLYPMLYDTVRFYIKEDEHIAAHAREDGFDIYFTDSNGNTLPCELVYYSEGTGEWWIDVRSYTDNGVIPTPEGLPAYNSGGCVIYYFYIHYGDHAKSTDPTTAFWSTFSGYAGDPSNPIYGLVAHTSYKAYDSNRVATEFSDLIYESETSSGRPINSFLFNGHTSGFTFIEKILGPYDAQHKLRDYQLGNPCALKNDPLSSTQYPLYNEAIQAGFNRTPWLPIYEDTGNNTYTPTGQTESILFAIKTAKYFSEYNPGDKTLYEPLLAYRNIAITVEYNTNTGANLCVHIDTGYHVDSVYTLNTIQWYPLVQNTGYVFLVSIICRSANNEPNVRLLDIKGVSTTSREFIANFNTVETIQTARFADHIIYGSLYDQPFGVTYTPYNANTYSYHHLVNLLEVRAPVARYPLPAYHAGTEENQRRINTFETSTKKMLNGMTAMLFRNEEIRTIETQHTSRIWTRLKTYQGLAGGCN